MIGNILFPEVYLRGEGYFFAAAGQGNRYSKK
jgi:hypothetical protein